MTDAGNSGFGVCNIAMETLGTEVCLFVASEPVARVSIPSSVWKRAISGGRNRSDGTHVKHTPNPLEVRAPGGNRLFIVLRTVTSRDHAPFTPLDDILPDLVRSPG